jgi:hypothetical protein
MAKDTRDRSLYKTKALIKRGLTKQRIKQIKRLATAHARNDPDYKGIGKHLAWGMLTPIYANPAMYQNQALTNRKYRDLIDKELEGMNKAAFLSGYMAKEAFLNKAITKTKNWFNPTQHAAADAILDAAKQSGDAATIAKAQAFKDQALKELSSNRKILTALGVAPPVISTGLGVGLPYVIPPRSRK